MRSPAAGMGQGSARRSAPARSIPLLGGGARQKCLTGLAKVLEVLLVHPLEGRCWGVLEPTGEIVAEFLIAVEDFLRLGAWPDA